MATSLIKVKKYLLVSRLAIQDLFEYKIDFILSSVKYSMMVLLMTIVWLAVEKEGRVGLMTQQQTILYFFFSAMLYSLSNFHPWYIEQDIQQGYLSKYLVKPISPTVYYCCFEGSKIFLETFLKISVFTTLLFLLGMLPHFSLLRLLLLIVYCPFIFLFSFQWLTLISLLAFWITEAYALRWAVNILTRFLAGIMVPILYFPEQFQRISFYLPFQHLAYTPIEFIMNKIDLLGLGKSLVILITWTIGLTLFRRYWWQVGLNQYEGTGI